MRRMLFAALFALVAPGAVFAHSGGTNSAGCHNCRTGSCAGTYHCHNSKSTPSYSATPSYAAPAAVATVSQATYNALESKVDDLEGTISDKTEQLTAALAELETLKKEFAGQEAELLKREKQILDAQTHITEMESDEGYVTLQKKHQNEINELQEDLQQSKEDEGGGGFFGLLAGAGGMAYYNHVQRKRRLFGKGDADKGRIKGNIGANGEKIYHTPTSLYYGMVEVDTKKGEKWFDTVREAEAEGWRAPDHQ